MRCANCGRNRGEHYNALCGKQAYTVNDIQGKEVSKLHRFSSERLPYMLDKYQQKVTIGDKVRFKLCPGSSSSLTRVGEIRDICEDPETGPYCCIVDDQSDSWE